MWVGDQTAGPVDSQGGPIVGPVDIQGEPIVGQVDSQYGPIVGRVDSRRGSRGQPGWTHCEPSNITGMVCKRFPEENTEI